MRGFASNAPAVFPAIQNDTVYSYGYDSNSRLVDVKQFDNTLCVNRAYTFDAAGNRLKKDTTFNSAEGLICGVESPMDPAVHQVLSYNDYSQLTSAGYVYDVFGRASTVPSVHTANQAGNVTFTYSPEDRILSQKQGTTQTDYNYDALGRRYQDKVGAAVKTVRHYGDESDNPSWVSGTGTAAAQVDIFTPALASNLNATRKVNGTTTTAYLNFGNLHGDTITSLQLPTTGFVSGPNELNVYDEYGVAQTPELDNRPVGVSAHTDTTQLFVLNYGSLGQPQRETTDTGIQFMGARGYNPITGQFLSPDPIQGGNETPYNYPNDPINFADTSGNLGLARTLLLDWIVNSISTAIALLVCGPLALACGALVKFAIGSLISLIRSLVDGEDFGTAAMNSLSAGVAAVLPGVGPTLLKKAWKSLKNFNKKLAQKTKFLKKRKTNEAIAGGWLLGWELGSAYKKGKDTNDWKLALY